MRYRQLGDSGLLVSVAGLGCNNFGRRLDAAATRSVVDAAIEAGITLFDTAVMYGGGGGSEALLGEALAGRRDKWSSPLDELVRDGKVRYVGSSNFSGWQIADAAHCPERLSCAPFISAQNHWSLLERQAEAEVVPAARRFGVGVLPYFPLANGLLTGKVRRGQPVPAGSRLASRPGYITEDKLDRVEALISWAQDQGETFPDWEHANVQRGIDAYLAAHSPAAAWFGISGSHRDRDDVLGLLTGADEVGQYRPGAVDMVTVATGPDSTAGVVNLGLVATNAPDGDPVILGLTGPGQHGGPMGPAARLDVLAASRPAATAVREEIERLMRQHDIYRGQVLSFGFSEHRGNRALSFLPRLTLTAEQVVLPPGVFESIERHVVGIGERSAALRAAGQHLKRGLLLHGAPGTGKNAHGALPDRPACRQHRYRSSPAAACTWWEQAAGLARRLQPAVVVVEDVDLVAMDRGFAPGGNPFLFALLDAMDGVGADADVAFVLTTNRAAVLERALADRPGRVDLAVEIPVPDEPGRERLPRLYARKLGLPGDLSEVVAATEGVTASYIKELLRRTVLVAMQTTQTPASLELAHFAAALTEMSAERESLTRSLLGYGNRPGEGQGPDT
jgi:Aldo/keto reductase family/ATPase family associated with various cellular activities (AAA)